MAAELCRVGVLVALVCLAGLCSVRAQALISLTEMSAIECGPTLDWNATCVQCAPVSNISLPASFFSSDVKCTRVQNFADNSLAYMSQANSASLSFYYVPENGTADCSGSEFMFSVNIPSASRCGTSPVQSLQYTIKSYFDQYGGETISVQSNAWVSCRQWLPYGSANSACPLEWLANTTAYCPTTVPGYSGFTAAVSFNMTVYNFCPPTCSAQYSNQCSTNFQQCQTTAAAFNTANPLMYSQLMCGCYEAVYACHMGSGCYPGGVGLTTELNNVNTYCAGTSNAVFNCATAPATTTTTTAPSTVASSAMTLTCTSSDFGGSFGGAIFGTFLMHAITGLVIYGRKRMLAQPVTVSKKPVAAEEAAMVAKD